MIRAGGSHSLAVNSDGTVFAWGWNDYGQSTVPAGLTGVAAVAAGYGHSLAVKSGTVVAWGYNAEGQSTVPAGLTGVMAVAGGDYHSLALKSDGTVVAWGYGESTVPAGLTGVVAVAAGSVHSLALKSDGTVVAWGNNLFGQSTVPAGLTGVAAIAAGRDHSLALKSDGTVVAWGDNFSGQSTVPAGLTGVAAIAAGGGHSLALKSDGTVVAWGSNYNGQSTVPAGLTGVAAIAAGGGHSLALKSDGTVVAWGSNYNGQSTVPAGLNLLLSDTTPPSVPTGVTAAALSSSEINVSWTTATDNVGVTLYRVFRGGSLRGTVYAPALSFIDIGLAASTTYSYTVQACDAVDNCSGASASTSATTPAFSFIGGIGAGGHHSLAVKANGTVVAWGANDYGQATVPASLVGVMAVAGGRYQSLALKSDGTVVAWGTASGPMPSSLLTGVVAVAGGYSHSLALKSDGTVVAWGNRDYLQTIVPSGLTGVVAVAAGNAHSLALKSDGTVLAWGDNLWGQSAVPAGLTGVVAAAGGGYHSLALKSDGTVVAWGNNYYGQTTVPAGLTGVQALAGGYAHSLALKSDGTVVAWGLNDFGQSTVPAGLSGVVAIAAGQSHSLALISDGTVVAWGDNTRGQSTVPAGLNLLPVADTTAPSIPTGLTATALGSSQINLAWTASTDNVGVTTYKLYRGGIQIATVSAPSTSYSDTGLAPSTSYSYTVAACDAAANCSAQSSSASATTPAPPDSTPPSVPTGLTANAVSNTRIDLSWNASSDNSGVTRYGIYRNGFLLIAPVGAPPVTTYSDNALTDATSYNYSVAACDAAGNCSAPSNSATATTAGTTVITFTPSLEEGFNLLGNSLNITIDVPAVFGNQDVPIAGVTPNILSVWKWNATEQRWSFYSPQLSIAGNATFVGPPRNYELLSTINAGEGYWVNAVSPMTLPAQTGTGYYWGPVNFHQDPPSGFSLIATAGAATPGEFNYVVSLTAPPPGTVSTDNFFTLWTWDAAGANWYFYSPLLESAGGLAAVKSYAYARAYGHFQDYGKGIGVGVGFWVNRP